MLLTKWSQQKEAIKTYKIKILLALFQDQIPCLILFPKNIVDKIVIDFCSDFSVIFLIKQYWCHK